MPKTYSAHTGGVFGKDDFPMRQVGVFKVPEFHKGYNSDEMLALVKKNETIFTESQMDALGDSLKSKGNMTVNIYNNSGADVKTSERKVAGGGMELDVIIDAIVGDKLSKMNSSANKSLRQGFGLAPALMRR